MPRHRWNRHRPLFSTPAKPAAQKPRRKWRVLPFLWRSLKRACTVIGAFFLFSLIMGAISTYRVMQESAPPLPDQLVLYIDFSDGFREMPQEASLAEPFSFGQPTLREVIDTIEKAKTDPRVQGIFARIDEGSFSLAHVQEVRAALKSFKEGGKFAYIYASSYGDGGNALGSYYLASAFDQIWMQPMGVVSITGLNAETPFFRGALEKIGVTPQFYHRKEYKSAYESFTNTEMSPANREMTEHLLGDIKAEILKEIPAERGITPREFEKMVDRGLFTAQEAVAAKLITKADYADILVENIKEDVTGDREAEDDLFVPLAHYMKQSARKNKGESLIKEIAPHHAKIALVYVVGTIMPSSTNASMAPAFMESGVAAADEIAPAILEAGDDPDVRAIVVRIDSPGGSPTASESILRAIERAQIKGKKVIVSMGPTAASGGYWIAAYADRIFAMPTTLTGSIGVLGGKVAVPELWEKIGVNWDRVQWGENAGMWSINTPFSESEAERINAMLDQVYDGFVARVARGREMSVEDVERIAKGRVWSGASAALIGLVDEIGGLNEALDFAAAAIGAPDRNALDIVIMPKPKNALEQFLSLLGEQASVMEGVRWQKAVAQIFAPVMGEIARSRNPESYATYEPLRVR